MKPDYWCSKTTLITFQSICVIVKESDASEWWLVVLKYHGLPIKITAKEASVLLKEFKEWRKWASKES